MPNVRDELSFSSSRMGLDFWGRLRRSSLTLTLSRSLQG